MNKLGYENGYKYPFSTNVPISEDEYCVLFS